MSKIKLTTSANEDIPLKHIDYKIDIYNQICQYIIRQTYLNTSENPAEVFYTFPLMTNTSVCDFEADINGKIIRTEIKPKTQAKKEYAQAIEDGNQAFYMEQTNLNIFSICLGNVPPNAKIIIRISCITELDTEIDARNLRVNIPLTIMPVYTPSTSLDSITTSSDILDSTPRTNTRPYDVTISGHVYISDSIVSFDSKTHQIKISNPSKTDLDFEINPDQLNSDIILTIERGCPKSFILTSGTVDLPISPDSIYTYATQINIIPFFPVANEISPTDMSYIIVLDTSGSMEGRSMSDCIKATISLVSNLPIGSRFNIYRFACDYSKWKSNPVKCTVDSQQEAIKWINCLKACGGTEVLPVLNDIYQNSDPLNLNTIIFMSDGGVSNTDKVIDLVKKNKHVSIYSIGIGQSVCQNLITEMAVQSSGRAEFINNTNDQIEEKVLAQLRRASQYQARCQTNHRVQIETTGQYQMIPELGPLYESDVNTFYVFSSEPVTNFVYEQLDSNYVIETEPTILRSDNNILHRMAGIKLINSLCESGKTGSRLAHMKADLLEDKVINISQSLGILSEYTAFIGVEIIEEKSEGISRPILKRVPIQSTNMASPDDKLYWDMISDPNDCIASFDIDRMLPRDVNNNWFGVNTIGSSLRNGTYDLRGQIGATGSCGCSIGGDKGATGDKGDAGSTANQSATIPNPKICISPWMTSTIEPDMTPDPIPSAPVVNHTIKIRLKSTDYIDLDTGIILFIENCVIPFIDQVKLNDLVILTLEDGTDGIYKIVSLDSSISPWILEKIY